jgi:TRAP-type C4-dicarboxylate transport system permease small subunit
MKCSGIVIVQVVMVLWSYENMNSGLDLLKMTFLWYAFFGFTYSHRSQNGMRNG